MHTPEYVIGIDSKTRNTLQTLDDKRVIYLAGQYVVIHDVVTDTQSLISLTSVLRVGTRDVVSCIAASYCVITRKYILCTSVSNEQQDTLYHLTMVDCVKQVVSSHCLVKTALSSLSISRSGHYLIGLDAFNAASTDRQSVHVWNVDSSIKHFATFKISSTVIELKNVPVIDVAICENGKEMQESAIVLVTANTVRFVTFSPKHANPFKLSASRNPHFSDYFCCQVINEDQIAILSGNKQHLDIIDTRGNRSSVNYGKQGAILITGKGPVYYDGSTTTFCTFTGEVLCEILNENIGDNKDTLMAAASSPDGKLSVVVTQGGQLLFARRQLRQSKVRTAWQALQVVHTCPIKQVVYEARRGYLIAVDDCQLLMIRDMLTNRVTFKVRLEQPPISMCLHPSNLFMVMTFSQEVIFYTVASDFLVPKKKISFQLSKASEARVAFNSHGSLMAAFCGREVKFILSHTQAALCSHFFSHEVATLQWARDDCLFVTFADRSLPGEYHAIRQQGHHYILSEEVDNAAVPYLTERPSGRVLSLTLNASFNAGLSHGRFGSETCHLYLQNYGALKKHLVTQRQMFDDLLVSPAQLTELNDEKAKIELEICEVLANGHDKLALMTAEQDASKMNIQQARSGFIHSLEADIAELRDQIMPEAAQQHAHFTAEEKHAHQKRLNELMAQKTELLSRYEREISDIKGKSDAEHANLQSQLDEQTNACNTIISACEVDTEKQLKLFASEAAALRSQISHLDSEYEVFKGRLDQQVEEELNQIEFESRVKLAECKKEINVSLEAKVQIERELEGTNSAVKALKLEQSAAAERNAALVLTIENQREDVSRLNGIFQERLSTIKLKDATCQSMSRKMDDTNRTVFIIKEHLEELKQNQQEPIAGLMKELAATKRKNSRILREVRQGVKQKELELEALENQYRRQRSLSKVCQRQTEQCLVRKDQILAELKQLADSLDSGSVSTCKHHLTAFANLTNGITLKSNLGRLSKTAHATSVDSMNAHTQVTKSKLNQLMRQRNEERVKLEEERAMLKQELAVHQR